jgi:hypothetical protein
LLELLGVTNVTKPLLLAAVAFAAFVFVYPLVRDRLPDGMNYETSSPVAQSASQLSSEEFAAIDSSYTPDSLGGLAGEATTKTEASVEGIRLECWYYGIAGGRGAYQVCFENGRFSTKTRFDQ